MSVVNDVALARTIASPLLLKVAKISLDKASSSQHWRKCNSLKRFPAVIQSFLFVCTEFLYYPERGVIDSICSFKASWEKFTAPLVLIFTMCPLSLSLSPVSLWLRFAKTTRGQCSLRHLIVRTSTTFTLHLCSCNCLSLKARIEPFSLLFRSKISNYSKLCERGKI